MFCILATSCGYKILFATIIFPPEDEIIYFESLRAKKQFSTSLNNPLKKNGYSEKLKFLTIYTVI